MMWTIIIIVIANFIIVKLFGINILKHLLFNPKINASIVGLGIIMNIISAVVDRKQAWLIIPWIVSILDCIQDVVWGENYYGAVEDHISPLYAAKCITSMFTRGISRAAFLLFTSLCIPRIALADVKSTFEGKRPTEVDPQYPYGSSLVANFFDGFYSMEFLRFADPYIENAVLYVVENLENLFMEWKVVRYDSLNSSYGCPYTDYQLVRKYCEKCKPYKSEIENIIKMNLSEGKFLTNEKCVDEEFQLRKDRLERAYPQKFLEKFAEKMTDVGKQLLAEREEVERELLFTSQKFLYTYVDINYYHNCEQKISEIMSNRGDLSACDIVELDELAFLIDLQKKDSGCNLRWREYFVIFIMQSLVDKGIIKEDQRSKKILDTHQYSHVNGKPRPSLVGSDPANAALYENGLGEDD